MLRKSHRRGIEPATCKSQVQRPTAESPRKNRYPCNRKDSLWFVSSSATSRPRSVVRRTAGMDSACGTGMQRRAWCLASEQQISLYAGKCVMMASCTIQTQQSYIVTYTTEWPKNDTAMADSRLHLHAQLTSTSVFIVEKNLVGISVVVQSALSPRWHAMGRPPVSIITFQPCDLWPWSFACLWVVTIALLGLMLRSKVKINP